MDPIVGDEDCQIIQVCNLLEKLETYELIITKLNDIALKLGVPPDKRQNIKTGLKLNTTSHNEALNEILISWRAKYSDEARLSVFLEVLDLCGLSDAADKLRESFACGRSLVLRQYECPPTGIEDFINSKHKLLVISTLDKNVTASKLKETMSCIHTNDNLEFVNKLQLVTATDKKLYSFECDDNFNLDDVFEFVRPAVKYKGVVITEEKLNVFKETHPKPQGVMFIEDTFEWAHLNPSYQFVVTKKFIAISGKRVTLREFRKEIRHLTDEMPSGQELLDLINDKEPNLYKSTVPPFVSYYIPRRISPRSLLNPDSLFRMADGQDKFMISGIDLFELSKYVKPETTDTSTNQRRMLEPKAARYIILDMESDFDEISKNYASNSHWIRHDKGKFSWVRSSGQINKIQRALESKNVQPEHSEDKFVDFLTNIDKSKTHVVISDTPGMGKTQLLSGLANRLISKGEMVIFGGMPRVLKVLKSRLEQDQEIKPAILDILSNLGEQSQSVQLYLKRALNTDSDHINVMLDGLDEIDSEDLSLAETVLKAISTLQSVRMWVSTRPHYLEILETWLQVLGHNIQPFNSEDQLNCLARYWKQYGDTKVGAKSLQTDRLLAFANTCLNSLQICMGSKYCEFAGIPLQCMLLGAVFEREARNYANPDIPDSEAVPPSINIRSVTDLYRRLIENKLDTYFERFPSSNYDRQQIKLTHMILSIQILFPKRVDDANDVIGRNFELVQSEDMLNIGLVETFHSEGKIDFIHRTIAEYFAADFVVHVVNERVKNGPGFELMDEVLSCRNYKFRISFDMPEIPLAGLHKMHIISSHKFKYELVLYFIDNIIQPTFALHNINPNVEMLQSCITGNFVNLFNHLSKSNQFQECLQKSLDIDLVISCVMYSDLSIVQRICEMYTNTSSIISPNNNKYSMVRTRLPGITVLHFAVRFREYKVVEYLINSQGFLELLTNKRIKWLFYYCVVDSLRSNDSIIRDKILTLKLLHRLNPQSLQCTPNDYQDRPLLASRVHVVLLCELITLGADVFVTTGRGKTLLVWAAEYLNSKDYHKLVSHIPVGKMSILLRQKLCDCVTMTTVKILCEIFRLARFDLDPETYLNFKTAGANFTGECGTSLLDSAIKGGKGVATFDQLLSHGAKWQPMNPHDWTLLHTAMSWDNFPGFQYFAIKFTDDVCLRQQIVDAQRWSDLHHANFRLLGIDLNAKDLEGNTTMHYIFLDYNINIEVMKLLAMQNRQMAIRVVKMIRKIGYRNTPFEKDLIGSEQKIIRKWNFKDFDLSLFGGHDCVVQ